MFDLKARTLLLSLLVVSTATLVSAAVLRDPMRPAVGSSVPVTVTAGQDQISFTWTLQSILRGKDREIAVIDGTSVARGEFYRGAKLLKVGAETVVLQSSVGKKIVLKLTPGIHKKMLSADTEKNLK